MLVATRTERLLQSQTVAGGYRLEPQTLALAMFLEVTRSKLACKANQVSAAVLAGFAKQLQGVPPEGSRCDPQQMCHLRSRVAADDKLEDARLGWRKAIDHCCRIDDYLRLVIAVGDEHGGDGVSGNASADCPFAQRQDMGDERAAVGSHPGYRNASPTERDIALAAMSIAVRSWPGTTSPRRSRTPRSLRSGSPAAMMVWAAGLAYTTRALRSTSTIPERTAFSTVSSSVPSGALPRVYR